MRVLDHARAFFSALALARAGRSGVEDRLRLTPEWFADHLDTGLRTVRRARRARGDLRAGRGRATRRRRTGPAAGRRGRRVDRPARRRAWPRELRFLLAAADAAYVYFLEVKGRTVTAAGRADRRLADRARSA